MLRLASKIDFISKELVDQAAKIILKDGISPRRKSRDYAVVINGEQFPYKLLVTEAAKLVGKVLNHDEFSSTERNRTEFSDITGYKIVSTKIDHSEIANFKHLLEYFVSHLNWVAVGDINHEGYDRYIKPLIDEGNFKHTGRGYRGDQIQNHISRWEDYLHGKICITIQSGYHKYKGAVSYLNWVTTGLNILAKWENGLIVGLYQEEFLNKEKPSRRVRFGSEFTNQQLGLFADSVTPTSALTDFYQTYNEAIIRHQNLVKEETKATMTSNNPSRNQILYGPPGTGKTFKLKNDYFKHFIVKETAQTREQFLDDFVSDLTWWQIITVVLLDLKRAKVLDIHEHELIRIKESLSTSKTVRPTIWGQLQSHTVLNCENVNVTGRSEPLYFHKDSKSNWSIVEEDLKEKFPEAYDLHSNYKNHIASPDVEIHNYDFVTFHQSFSYEDFIEGIKPNLDDETGGEIKFKVEDGVFKRISDRARRDPENNYALFIDEINRGNVSAIFGELITLIEDSKRAGMPEQLEVTLPYSKEKFSVPSNLYIIGTMNTADRSVEALDSALRRRFVFEEMLPNYELPEMQQMVFDYPASSILEKINQRIELLIDRDHCIGHAYFLGKDEETIIDSFYKNIIPLLQEYFFGDYGKIGLVLGEGFVEISKNENVVFADFFYDYKEDLASKPIYRIRDYQNDDNRKDKFAEAIALLMRHG